MLYSELCSNVFVMVPYLQSNLIDSESSSLSVLNTSEDDDLDDNIMDNSFASSQLNQSLQQGGSSIQPHSYSFA